MARTRQPLLVFLCVVALLDFAAGFHAPLTHAFAAKSHVLGRHRVSPVSRTDVLSLRCSHEKPQQEGPLDAAEHIKRRHMLVLLAPALLSSLGAPSASFAQRPPPKPKTTSIPEECRQAGACGGMAQAQDGMPQFKTAPQAPEVLDPKSGKYSAGLKIQDIAPGDISGPEVTSDSFVSMQYVLRRANGYFVDASYGFDRFDTLDFKMGRGQMVPGVEQALIGMHKGGRRRFVVPPELGYTGGVEDTKPGPMPAGWGERRALDSHRREPLVFEVQVMKVK